MLIVFTIAPNVEEAEMLAMKIIEAKLAACVQVLPEMKSFYVWEGKISQDAENLLLIKTLEGKYDELERFIRSNHSYEIPEIIAVSSEKMSEEYLTWMKQTLK